MTSFPLTYSAMALLVVAVVGWAVKQYLGEFFKKSGASAFDRSRRPLSRGAKFRRRLVRRYAEAVEQDFTRHPVGFVTDRVIDIDEAYVPLQHELGGERRDLYDSIRENPRTVVIGPAGAGKSLLLKNSMLTWAKRVRSGLAERVPVLIELHRCNGTTDGLVDLIVGELARSRVDKARRVDRIRDLVEQALRDGALSLLFDGLDEVGRADQERVFSELRDFAREYAECQVVVTCRDVVYQGQPLGPQFSHVVRVAEFDDAGVIRFLGNWRGLEDPTARAEVFGSLRKNPALMRLARSPLLLTMIAYLHTEVFTKTGRRLPTSRPAFYREAITHLLGRDTDLGRAGSLTAYEVGEKLAVLQQVALTSMESSAGWSVDRLTIPRTALETTTKALLPDLNLEDSHIKPLLDEVIDRSQLLVAVDKGRTHFVFRHLTLQEYLTAVELADDPDGLLERYLADPLVWRETVKLWCGASSRDSTKVIAEVFGSAAPHHKILALECLAEARRVDGDFATTIVDHFLGRLGRGTPDRAAVITALGSVAADGRPRGQEVLARLALLARTDGPAKADAMQALSASGRPEAAAALAPRADSDADGRAALRGMGELALGVLTARASSGHLWAVDDLAVVGTPAAAAALVELLWDDQRTATRAAWRLAELIRIPDAEDQLRRLPKPSTDLPVSTWFWRPFARGDDDPLPVICGRVGRLLEDSSVDLVPSDVSVIDPRFAVPLAVKSVGSARLSVGRVADQLKFLMRGTEKYDDGQMEIYLDHLFAVADKAPVDGDWFFATRELVAFGSGLSLLQRRLLGLLSWPAQVELYRSQLIGRGHSSHTVRDDDWPTVLDPRHGTRLLELVAACAFGGTIACLLLTGLFGAFTVFTNGASDFPELVGYGEALGLLASFMAMLHKADGSEPRWMSRLVHVAMGVSAVVLAVTGAVAVAVALPWVVVALIVGVDVVAFGCWLLYCRRERVNDNPYRRCLEADASRLVDRTSVIAT